MALSISQTIGNDRKIPTLFVLGLVGLIIAVSGIMWIVIGYITLLNRVMLYTGSWTHLCDTCDISSIEISNDGLTLTFVIKANTNFCSGGCTSNTISQTFVSEPITITVDNISVMSSTSTSSTDITLMLNNAQGTQLKVIEGSSTFIFHKNGP